MKDVSTFVAQLTNKDNMLAANALQELLVRSKDSKDVYPYFESFVHMVQCCRTCVRVKGYVLISANICWDKHNQIDHILPIYLSKMLYEKPMIMRQCLQGLQPIMMQKPHLKEAIIQTIQTIDTSMYNDLTRSLLKKDIRNVMKLR